MNLRVTGIREKSAALVGAPDCRCVRALGVSRQIVDVPVATGSENHGIGELHAQFAGDQVAGDNAPRLSIDNDQVQHFGARKHRYLAEVNLPLKCLVCAQQKLLPGLAAGVERTRHLGAAEGAILQRTSVFASKGNALRDALINNVHAVLRQPVDVRFARAEVAAFYRVIEEAVDTVAVVLVVLGCIDAALRSNGMGASRRVLKAVAKDVVAQFTESCGS